MNKATASNSMNGARRGAFDNVTLDEMKKDDDFLDAKARERAGYAAEKNGRALFGDRVNTFDLEMENVVNVESTTLGGAEFSTSVKLSEADSAEAKRARTAAINHKFGDHKTSLGSFTSSLEYPNFTGQDGATSSSFAVAR